MTVHDAHSHIFPDKIAAKATKSIGDFYEFSEMFSIASPDALIETGREINIGLRLVCSAAVTKEQVDGINTFISSECQKHKTFIGLAAIHPDTDDFDAVLDFTENNGLMGIKLHPDFQKFNIDDKRVYPLYKSAEKRKLPILFHMGDNRYDFSSPLRLKKIMEAFPDLKVMAAHFGGYMRWDEALTLEKSENLFFDTSSALPFMEKSVAYKFFDKFGTDNFMFGTDFPMWSPKDELERFLSLDLGDEANEKILSKNFERLFNLDCKSN